MGIFRKNTDFDRVRTYQELAEAGRVDNEQGGNYNLFFCEGDAIKYPRDYLFYRQRTKEILEKNLLKEFKFGLHLRENGFWVPQMKGFYSGERERIPILVMERLDLVPISEIPPSDLDEQKARFYCDDKKIKNLGYFIDNSSFESGVNCGWNPKNKRVYRFDFETWQRLPLVLRLPFISRFFKNQ